DLGNLQSVNPFLVALLYAGDRNNYKETINHWLENNYYVLADRYVFSNIAFQCAKTKDKKQKEELKQWILHTEYEYFNIPKPDINIFLDVPLSTIENRLQKNRKGDDRSYLNGKNDIHEADFQFQRKVRSIYDELLISEKRFFSIPCMSSKKLLEPKIIHQTIINTLKINKIL
ncbi:MAG: thymidylate kinase, partial [Bacteroidales bacterium]|nr:thymidylate kinase [Bacteroidales bacterium]